MGLDKNLEGTAERIVGMRSSLDIETEVSDFYKIHKPKFAENATVTDFAGLLNEQGLRDYAEKVNDRYFNLMADESDGEDSLEDTWDPGSLCDKLYE